MKSYKDSAAYRHREPLQIIRTKKRSGDLVLHQSFGPASVVPGRKGRFAGKTA